MAVISGQRVSWIDNLRIMVIMLVVVLHTAVTYSGIGSWYYVEKRDIDTASTVFFALFQSFTQAYFMGLLFMVSGYFSNRSLQRKGSRGFLSGRLFRLGIPLLIYIFVIHPVAVKIAYPEIELLDYYLRGIKTFRFPGWTGPLWFVEALLIFTFFYVALEKIYPGRRISINLKYSSVSLIIATMTGLAFLLRLFYPLGTDFYNLQIGFFASYVFLFAIGITAYNNNLFNSVSFRDGIRWLFISLGFGIPSWFLIMFLGGPMEGDMRIAGGWNWPAFFFALWESFFCVSFILALIGIFQGKMNISSNFQRFLSDNAFGVFVFHAPVLIGISQVMSSLDIHPVAKFFLVATIAVPSSFLVSALIRSIHPLRKIFT